MATLVLLAGCGSTKAAPTHTPSAKATHDALVGQWRRASDQDASASAIPPMIIARTAHGYVATVDGYWLSMSKRSAMPPFYARFRTALAGRGDTLFGSIRTKAGKLAVVLFHDPQTGRMMFANQLSPGGEMSTSTTMKKLNDSTVVPTGSPSAF